MSTPFVDTDVIIRLLTTDDPKKAAAAAALFQKVEDGTLQVQAPDTVIADAVGILSNVVDRSSGGDPHKYVSDQ